MLQKSINYNILQYVTKICGKKDGENHTVCNWVNHCERLTQITPTRSLNRHLQTSRVAAFLPLFFIHTRQNKIGQGQVGFILKADLPKDKEGDAWKRMGITEEHVKACMTAARTSVDKTERKYWKESADMLLDLRGRSYPNTGVTTRNWIFQIKDKLIKLGYIDPFMY